MEIRMVETLGVRQAASVNHVLVVKSAGGLVCEHSESQTERDSTLKVGNLGADEDRDNCKGEEGGECRVILLATVGSHHHL